MGLEQPVRCAKCFLRMESYELRTVCYKRTYHRHCFVMLLREKAAQEKVRRAGTGLPDAARPRS
jgi:hypothetical protein